MPGSGCNRGFSTEGRAGSRCGLLAYDTKRRGLPCRRPDLVGGEEEVEVGSTSISSSSSGGGSGSRGTGSGRGSGSGSSTGKQWQ